MRTLREILRRLRESYCGAIGYEVGGGHCSGGGGCGSAAVKLWDWAMTNWGLPGKVGSSGLKRCFWHCAPNLCLMPSLRPAAVHAHPRPREVQLAAGAH